MQIEQTQNKKPAIVLLIHTPQRRYAVKYADITNIRSCTSQEEVASWGSVDRPGIAVDLGELLDQETPVWPQRASALIVTMRRRQIAFVVKKVEEMLEQPNIRPLPEMMCSVLRNQWATGVLDNGGELSIVLDLRELARSILVGHKA